MIVLNFGIPRSGTTWVYNVVRHILERFDRGYTTVNANKPKEVDQALAEHDEQLHLLMHFHDLTQKSLDCALQPKTISICNYRDPRDVVVSQMNLHDATFEIAIKMTDAAFMNLKIALNIPHLILIPYPFIQDHPASIIFQIGVKMEVILTPNCIDRIIAATDIEKHKKIMAEVRRAVSASDTTGLQKTFTGNRMIYGDKESLINDRHIQSGRSGRWRDELTDPQKEIVNQAFADTLKVFGFASEPG